LQLRHSLFPYTTLFRSISRTFRVFFDLITIRFLLRYLSRPLHFFGTVGMLSILSGFSVAGWLVFEKLLRHSDLLIQHGPLMIFRSEEHTSELQSRGHLV